MMSSLSRAGRFESAIQCNTSQNLIYIYIQYPSSIQYLPPKSTQVHSNQLKDTTKSV